ncbi:MAG: hypothetical protein ACLSV2_12500 [Clostridium sp.]
MLKLELKRGLKRKTFIVALLVTTIFCVVQHLVSNYWWIIMPHANDSVFFDTFLKSGIVSAYQCFIFFNLTPLGNLLFILMPILVAISYGDSYLEDLNSGFLKNILSRCSKQKYLKSKFLANFIISGITIAIPLIVNLLLLITTQASILPEKLSTNTLMAGSLNLDMYLNHPALYILMWILIYFAFAGAISSITLGLSMVTRNKFIVLIAPFIIVQAMGILLGLLNLRDYSVAKFLYSYPEPNPIAMFITFTVIIMATFLPFYFGGKSNELF